MEFTATIATGTSQHDEVRVRKQIIAADFVHAATKAQNAATAKGGRVVALEAR